MKHSALSFNTYEKKQTWKRRWWQKIPKNDQLSKNLLLFFVFRTQLHNVGEEVGFTKTIRTKIYTISNKRRMCQKIEISWHTWCYINPKYLPTHNKQFRFILLLVIAIEKIKPNDLEYLKNNLETAGYYQWKKNRTN